MRQTLIFLTTLICILSCNKETNNIVDTNILENKIKSIFVDDLNIFTEDDTLNFHYNSTDAWLDSVTYGDFKIVEIKKPINNIIDVAYHYNLDDPSTVANLKVYTTNNVITEIKNYNSTSSTYNTIANFFTTSSLLDSIITDGDLTNTFPTNSALKNFTYNNNNILSYIQKYTLTFLSSTIEDVDTISFNYTNQTQNTDFYLMFNGNHIYIALDYNSPNYTNLLFLLSINNYYAYSSSKNLVGTKMLKSSTDNYSTNYTYQFDSNNLVSKINISVDNSAQSQMYIEYND